MNNTQAGPQYGGNTQATSTRAKEDLVQSKQAAEMLGVTVSSIQSWTRKGKLKFVATTPCAGGRTYLYLREDIVAYGKNNRIIRHKKHKKHHFRDPKAALPAPSTQTHSKRDTRTVVDPDIHGRIARLVRLLDASNTPFEATAASVTRAALRIGLTQLEKEAKS